MDTSAKPMKWASALSTQPSLEAAVDEVVTQATQRLRAEPDLALVFISAAFASEFSRLMPLLQARIQVPVWLGCSGGGVIGMGAEGAAIEAEGRPALSLSLASLPGVALHSFHCSAADLPDLDSPPDRWSELVGVDPQSEPHFILMADPFSAGINDLLQGLDFAYPGAVKIGGLASIGSINRSCGLFCQGELIEEGVVGVALAGNVVLDAIVAQGCRPIGQPYRVAEGERNVLLKLETGSELDPVTSLKTPMDVLQDLFQSLDEADRELAQHSLFIGVEQSGFKPHLEQGDFLIRNLIGVDPKVGAIAIGDRVRPGQRIQFHLRDAQTSADDLRLLLDRYQSQHDDEPKAAGALMFACMGRGEGLYDEANFDSGVFSRYFEQTPISGFFCGGEIGPIGGTTFLHGYTSVFGICRQPEPAAQS
ncbi:MAG: FIST signal transduction protein [Almyronema sp.]